MVDVGHHQMNSVGLHLMVRDVHLKENVFHERVVLLLRGEVGKVHLLKDTAMTIAEDHKMMTGTNNPQRIDVLGACHAFLINHLWLREFLLC